MNVQELINELNKIDDKEMLVATKQYDSRINVIVDKESLQYEIETVNKQNSNYVRL